MRQSAVAQKEPDLQEFVHPNDRETSDESRGEADFIIKEKPNKDLRQKS